MKESATRIKINKLIEKAGCHFFADARESANIKHTFHVWRVGSFKSNPENIASYSRNFPDIAYNSIASETSFRLARTVFV